MEKKVMVDIYFFFFNFSCIIKCEFFFHLIMYVTEKKCAGFLIGLIEMLVGWMSTIFWLPFFNHCWRKTYEGLEVNIILCATKCSTCTQMSTLNWLCKEQQNIREFQNGRCAFCVERRKKKSVYKFSLFASATTTEKKICMYNEFTLNNHMRGVCQLACFFLLLLIMFFFIVWFRFSSLFASLFNELRSIEFL